jgi:dGTP triphosphohydrolase
MMLNKKDNQALFNDTVSYLENINKSKFDFKNLDDYKPDIIEKLTELQNKYAHAKAIEKLIEPWGHKDNTLYQSKDKDYENNIRKVYCAILLCTSGLYRHRVSSNTAIERVREYIKYIKENSPDLYITLETAMKSAEFPFRSEGEYSQLLIYYPPKNISDFIDELKKDTRSERYENFYKKSLALSIQPIDGETSDETNIRRIREMLERNASIFVILFFEIHGPLRSRYKRETERITKSEYFRFMQYKAQVMFNNASDDQRTRLTHSLEVALSAKTIAKQLGCNWELAEAAAMGHDLGHVPFGHQGEEALDECLHKAWAGRFSHSLQSVKILGYLANHSYVHRLFGINGLCISRPVLECVLKHDTDNLLHDIRKPSWRLQYNGWREALIGAEETENEFVDGVTIGGLESQIVYWSDKISYAAHDWEELTNNGLIEKMASDVEQILRQMHQLRHIAHGRIGNRDFPDIIETEIDIIRFIRYYIELIRDGLITPSAIGENEISEGKAEEERIVRTFRPDKTVFNKMESGKLYLSCDRSKTENPKSPIVCFIKAYEYILENQIATNLVSISVFTRKQYQLLFDFFSLCHNMIFLTGIFPKIYKKSDDVEKLLCRYLTEIDGREITRALQTQIICESRNTISKQCKEAKKTGDQFDEKYILKWCLNSFKDKDTSIFGDSGFKKVDSLETARRELSNYGYVVVNSQDKSIHEQFDAKKLKSGFKTLLQSKMFIRLPSEINEAHNRIAEFVHQYYIGSERVRAMKNKAHMIVKRIFEFFMDHHDMLPEDRKRMIDVDTQKLCTLRDNFYTTDNKKYGLTPKLLVIQYLLERLDRKAHKESDTTRLDNAEDYIYLIDILEELTKNDSNFKYDSERNFGGKEFLNLLCKWKSELEKLRKIKPVKSINPFETKGYYNVCNHIAKARVIADYIASMTDRFAEKKYTEIVSSQAAWTTAFYN